VLVSSKMVCFARRPEVSSISHSLGALVVY